MSHETKTPADDFKHRAYFRLSYRALEQLLGMPPDHHIVIVDSDPADMHETMRVFIEGPSLPEVRRGEACIQVRPTLIWNLRDGKIEMDINPSQKSHVEPDSPWPRR